MKENCSDLKQTETICIASDEDVIEDSPDVKVLKKRNHKTVDDNLVLNEIINESLDKKRKRNKESDCFDCEANDKGESASSSTQKKKYVKVKSSEELFGTSRIDKMAPKKQTPVKSTSFSKKSPKSRENTPIKQKRTPVKLFSKSPKVNDFNVQVIENFIKITPSKSNKKTISSTPTKSSKKRQNLILNYISPSTSNR